MPRSLVAIAVAIVAGAAAYDGLALEFLLGSLDDATRWSRVLGLLAPAMLVALFFATFVLMPLWLFVARTGTRRKRLLFVAVGSMTWAVVCAALLAAGVVQRGFETVQAATLLIPGLMLVSIFGLLA